MQVRQIYQITREYDELQIQITQRLADEIETYVKNHRNAVEALAAGITSARERDPERLTSYLRAMQQNLPGFVNLYIADKHGITTAFYPETDASGKSLIGYDFSDRDYYKQVSTQGITIISSLFKGRGGTSKPLITIAAPIFDRTGAFDGYVLGALDLTMVEVLATKYDYGKNGYAVIVDNQGKAIYHPDAGIRLDIKDLSEETVMKNRNSATHGAGNFYSITAQQEEYTTYSAIPSLNWMVWVSKPSIVHDEEFYRSLRSTVVFLIVAWLLTGAVAWFLAKRFNGSITPLVRYARALAEEGFDAAAIELTDGRGPRELNVLSQTFRHMAEKIKQNEAVLLQLNSELEERVTDRMKENLALLKTTREQHASLQAILESMSDAIVIVDTDGTVTYANQRMAELFDLPVENMRVATEDDIRQLAGERYPQSKAELDKLFSGQLGNCILTSYTEGQPSRHIATTSFHVKGRLDEAIGRGYVWRDITKEHEVDQLKNSLISLASHEFKTPLTSIKGSVETLLRSDTQWDAAFQREMLESALEDVARIQDLVDDWLDISKIDAGTLSIRPKLISARGLITKSVERFSRYDGKANLTVTVMSDMPLIYADPGRLEQVLVNLISNGIRYNDRQPEIEIFTSFDDCHTYIHVKDNGIGIAAENLERIFERFYQVDVSSTRRSGGTGLGLAISKGIMEAHKGEIQVTSAVGLGSIFTLVLPRMREEGGQDEKTADFYS